jgi:predicted DNA-binding transcriptional regulator YafY
LRELGTAPVVEAADGTVQLVRRESQRARTPPARREVRPSVRIAATVTAIRAGDRAATARPSPALRAAEPTTPAANLAVLREAVEQRESVWLAYLDNHGSTLERVVDPVKVEAGWLSAYDHRTEDVRSFAVHRITAVRRLS